MKGNSVWGPRAACYSTAGVGFSGRVHFRIIFISLKTTTKPKNETISKPLGLTSEIPSSCDILKSMKVSKSGLSGLCP